MKKILLLLSVAFLFVACDKDMKGTQGTLTPDEQKEKLEDVALEFTDCYPAETFDEFFELSEKFAEAYFDEDYDWDDVLEYCEEKADGMYEFFESGSVDHYVSTTDLIIMLSDIEGKIVLGSRSARCSDYDGVRVEFELGGNDYVADLTFSGKKTLVEYSFVNSYEDYYESYEDTYNFTVEVPETISLVITENGSKYAEVTLSMSFSLSYEEVNFTRDNLFVSTSIKIGDNELILKQSGYDALKDKLSAGCTLKKGSKVIVDADFSADVDVDVDIDEDELYTDVDEVKNINIYLDILGELQIKGSCSDLLSLAENMNDLYEASSNSDAERLITRINKQLDLGLYYNGSSNKTADIVMEYYVEEEYDGEEWYDIEPILQFSDGSSYTFFEYFDEDFFEDMVDSFERWLENYETMLKHYFE